MEKRVEVGAAAREGQRAGGEAGAGPEAPSRRGAGTHLGQNKGRTHLRRRRRRGLGRAAGAYLGLRGFLRGSVCRAGRSQDGTIAGRGQADESQRRAGELLPGQVGSGQAVAAAAAGGGLGRDLELGRGRGRGGGRVTARPRGAGPARRRQWRRRVGLAQAPLVAMETARSGARRRRPRPRPGSGARRLVPARPSPASRGNGAASFLRSQSVMTAVTVTFYYRSKYLLSLILFNSLISL